MTIHPGGRTTCATPFRGAVLSGSFNPLHEGHSSLLVRPGRAADVGSATRGDVQLARVFECGKCAQALNAARWRVRSLRRQPPQVCRWRSSWPLPTRTRGRFSPRRSRGVRASLRCVCGGERRLRRHADRRDCAMWAGSSHSAAHCGADFCRESKCDLLDVTCVRPVVCGDGAAVANELTTRRMMDGQECCPGAPSWSGLTRPCGW